MLINGHLYQLAALVHMVINQTLILMHKLDTNDCKYI